MQDIFGFGTLGLRQVLIGFFKKSGKTTDGAQARWRSLWPRRAHIMSYI
jgi:hypothetical protein